jgi:hypothetical protein
MDAVDFAVSYSELMSQNSGPCSQWHGPPSAEPVPMRRIPRAARAVFIGRSVPLSARARISQNPVHYALGFARQTDQTERPLGALAGQLRL